jgi:hypothetical protein
MNKSYEYADSVLAAEYIICLIWIEWFMNLHWTLS